jgi:hypothetical protein
MKGMSQTFQGMIPGGGCCKILQKRGEIFFRIAFCKGFRKKIKKIIKE